MSGVNPYREKIFGRMVLSGFRIVAVAALFASSVICAVSGCGSSRGPEWPVYGGDSGRSFAVPDSIRFPLGELWRYHAAHEPRPAWPEPAAQDYYHDVRTIAPELDFDRANHVVVSDGKVLFGSSADDRIHALDADTGHEKWSFACEGPVRFAPSVSRGRVYVGSDDGCVYCLDADRGALLWKNDLSAGARRIPGNERIISVMPVRTSVIVDADTVWCAAGLFPAYGARLYALNARSGGVLWSHEIGISPQGYIASTPSRLILPAGRSRPAIHGRGDGGFLGLLDSPGGSFALACGTSAANGPGRREGQLSFADGGDTESVVRFNGIRMVLADGIACILSTGGLTVIDRTRYTLLSTAIRDVETRRRRVDSGEEALPDDEKARVIAILRASADSLASERTACRLWERPIANGHSLLRAGGALFVGCDGEVAVYGVSDGSLICRLPVEGRAYSLAAAYGRLYVSTDRGVVHCFSPDTKGEPRVSRPEPSRNLADTVSPEVAEAAERILRESGAVKGYCIDVDTIDGSLACELARHSSLQILCAASNEKTIARARRTIADAGLSDRISVIESPSGCLPLVHYAMNLVVSERAFRNGTLPPSAAEIERILRPSGGTACFIAKAGAHLKEAATWTAGESVAAWVLSGDGGMLTGRRGDLPGVGEWKQLYADPANTSCSGDSLSGPMTLQWFGRPGPRDMVDRHHRTSSPLYGGGRVFFPGNDRIYGMDAYNGTLLWERVFPGTRRIGALKDSGNLVLDGDDLLYAAVDSCLVLDTATGETKGAYPVAPLADSSPAEWGYLSVADGLVIGTVQKRGSSFRDLDFRDSPVNGSFLQERDYKDVIVSKGLFALDRATGATVWEHDGGAVMNNTVAIDSGRVFFFGTANPEITQDDGRVRIDDFCRRGAYLAALDLHTGQRLWTLQQRFPFDHIMYVSCADGIVLVTGSFNQGGMLHYGLFAYSAADGSDLWRSRFVAQNLRGTDISPLNGDHGEQWQHPVIVGNTVYLRPYAFDLHTGAKLDFIAYRGGHGCGGMTGSARYLFGRGSNPRMYPLDVPSTEGIPLTLVSRPGCWINMIPAGGILTIPESSSGCTCDYAIQTSMAFSMAETD